MVATTLEASIRRRYESEIAGSLLTLQREQQKGGGMTNKFDNYTIGELQHYADKLLDRIEVAPNCDRDDYYRFEAYLEHCYTDRVSLIEAIEDMQNILNGRL